MKIRLWICALLAFAFAGHSAHGTGKTVHVREYTRKDGTVVRAHDRAAPGTKSSGGSTVIDPAPPRVADDDSGDTVYVTKSGSKYHRAGCRYLKSSSAISLSDAIGKYSPCSVCHPPTEVSRKKETPKSVDKKVERSPLKRPAVIPKAEEEPEDPEHEEKLAQSRFDLADSLKSQGNDTAAKRRFEDIIKEHPNTKAAHLAAAKLGVPAPELRPGTFRGKVVAIADGDTVTILDSADTQHKIRLQGIDAPEKKQAFGTKSKENLSQKIFGQRVTVKWKQKDKYGRILGEIFLDDRHVNLEMVEDGMAWHYKQYSKDTTLAKAEEKAREAKRGLWADAKPVPPWEFRKSEAPSKAGALLRPATIGTRQKLAA